MVGIKHESMRKEQTSHKNEHNTLMCFPLEPMFTRDKGRLPNFMDEPASGLDPRARYEFKEIIRQLRKEGRTIMISSHILSDLSEMCTNICIIDEGRCVMEGSVDEIEYHMITASPLVIRTAGRQEDAIRLIRQNEMVETLSYNENEIQAVFKGEREDEVMLLHELMAADIPVYSFGRDRSSLETLFMQITDREVKEHAHESGL